MQNAVLIMCTEKGLQRSDNSIDKNWLEDLLTSLSGRDLSSVSSLYKA